MDMELIGEASLAIKDNITSLLYYPPLNVLCVSLEDSKLAFIEASSANFVKVIDIPENDGPFCLNVFKERLVVCKSQTFNARGDINGTFLVDSLFQGAIPSCESKVIIDLPCVEATQLLKLIQGYRPENVDEDGENLIISLIEAIEQASSKPKPSHKIAKWETITLKVKHSTFTKLLQDVLQNLPNANIAGVPVLASVLDRLNNLTLSDEENRMMVLSGEKNVMNVEANRRMTFSKWPHMNYRWALPDQMAQAGFFHKPAGSESDDRALCFLCNICLVSWEPTDEPWSEHERHSSTCSFVKAEFTTNIPLSVTYATEPARCHTKQIEILSNTNSNKLIATASKSGDFTIWDLSLKNRKASEFSLSYFPLFCYDKDQDFSQCIEIHSACVLDRWRANRKNFESEAHTLVVGARLKHFVTVSRFLQWPLSCSLEVTRELERRSSEEDGSCIFLLVFDLVQITRDEFSDISSEFKNPFLPDIPPPASPNSEDMEWKPPSYEAAMEEKEIKFNFLKALNLEDIGDQINTNSGLFGEELFPPLLSQSNTSSSVSRKIAMLNYDIPYIFADYSVHLKQMLPLVIGDKLCSQSCEVASITPTTTGAGKAGVLINVKPKVDHAGEFDPDSSGGLLLYPYLEFQTSDLELLLDPSPSFSLPLCGGECARSLCIIDSELTDSVSTDSDDTIGAANNESNRASYEPAAVNSTEASAHSDDQIMLDEAPNATNYPPWILLSMSGDIVAVNANSIDSGAGKSTHRVKNSSGRSTSSANSSTNNTKFTKLLLPAAKDYKDRFTAIEYCTGMDRLCGVTSGRQIHLFQIIRNEADDNRDLLDSSGQAIQLAEASQPSDNQKNTPLPTDTSDFLAHNKPLEHLVQLHDLIQYDLLQARIDTSLPRCWVELKQDQLTRQPQSAPNIIQPNDMGNTFSRSWTLIRDIGTWEEHVIELGLPKVVCVGHIDVKIHLDDLQGEPAPNIFVTLLRQNVSNVNLDSGISSRNIINGENSCSESVHSSTSTTPSHKPGLISNTMDSALPIVDLDAPYMDDAPALGRFQQASPISQEQLRQLHADVIAGPYCLADYLDLSGHVAIIPMTSAELVKCRSRLFAIHIKAVGETPDQDYNDQISDIANRDNPPPSPRPYKKKHSRDTRGRTNGVAKVLIQNTGNSNSYIVTNSSSSNANNFDDNGNAATNNNTAGIQESGCVAWKGCDIIRQLSVTVRKFKRTSLHQERAQRLAILRSSQLHEILMNTLSNPNPTVIANDSNDSSSAYLMGVQGVTALPHLRHLLINMLNWIALMYLNELNGKNPKILNLLTLCSDHVDGMIVTLLIGGDRSIAKKIAKLFISFIELDKHLNDAQTERYIFTPKLHAVLKYRLELLLLAESSVGVGWYFLLLDRLDREIDSSETTKIKAKFLEKLVQTYRERNSGFEATVLRSEFGLFHNPLEANLFDVDYQLSYKLGSTSLAGGAKSGVGGAGPHSYAQAVMIGPNAGGNVSHIFPQSAAVPIQTVHGNIANLLNSHLTAAGLPGVPGTAAASANAKSGVTEEVIHTLGEQVFIKDVLKMIKQAAKNLMGSSNRKSHDNSDNKKDGRKKHLRNMSSIDDLQIFQSRGLIEAEPLHVSCSSTSEGTRLEKIDSQSGLPTVVPILTNAYPSYLQPNQASSSFSNLPYNPMKDLKSTKLQILKKQMNEASKLSTKKPILPFSTTSVPPTPKTTPATTTQSTPMHITPSVTPPNETINSYNKLTSSGETVKDQVNDKSSLLSNSLLNTDFINHQLMTSPELHQLVVERMHPGARRYVVLSFGKPVLLTDILVPACSELTSFSIDVSLLPQDDSEFQRIIVSTDIANHPLIVTNVEPPILCQYVKITIVGRMGTTANKARIPLGSFFGHSMVFPWEINLSTCAVDSHHHALSKPKKNMQILETTTGSGSLDQDVMVESSSSHSSAHLSKVSLALNRLKAVSEDMTCRYGLASYQLIHLISLYKSTDPNGSGRLELAVQIRQVYEQCADLQRQLNVIRCTFQRLGGMVSNHVGLTVESTDKFLQDKTPLYQQACTDKIRCLTEFCLQSLLSQNCSVWNNLEESSSFEQISLSSNLMAALPEPDTLKQLFLNLIVFGNKSMQIMSVGLLSHMCSVASITNQINFTQWWSNWIRQVLNSFFTSSPTWMVPQNRIFVLLCAIIQQMIISGLGRLICDDLLHFLNGLLQPLMSCDPYAGAIDQELLNWVLLLTNTTLDYIPKEFTGSEHSGGKSYAMEGRDAHMGNRWDFLTWHHTQSKEENNKKSRVELSKLYRRKLHKRLLHHKQKLLDLKKAKEEFMNSQKQSESESQISQQQAKVWIRKKTEEEFNKHFNILTQKHMKDLMQLKKNEIDLCRRFDKKFPPHNSLSGMNFAHGNSSSGGAAANQSSPRPMSPSGSHLSRTRASPTLYSSYSDVPLVPYSAVKPVVTSLFVLLRRMDSTVNQDLFLRTCKVIGRLMTTCQPPLRLGEVISSGDLYELLERACQPLINNMSVSFAGHYGLHALACLMADLLEMVQDEATMTDMPPQQQNFKEDSTVHGAALESFDVGSGNEEEDDQGLMGHSSDTIEKPGFAPEPPPIPSSSNSNKDNYFFIDYPEVLDSDTDTTDYEFLADVHEVSNYMPAAPLSTNSGYLSMTVPTTSGLPPIQRWPGLDSTLNEAGLHSQSNTPLGITASYDMRAENGLELRVDLQMIRWSAQLAYRAETAVNSLCPPADIANLINVQGGIANQKSIQQTAAATAETAESADEILQLCLNNLFCNVAKHNLLLDPILQLWLYLNQDYQNSQWSSKSVPYVPLSQEAVIALLEALTNTYHLPTLHLGLCTLTLSCNQKGDKRVVGDILSSEEMRNFMLHLLMTSSRTASLETSQSNQNMGPATLDIMQELLNKLRLYCADLNTSYIPFIAGILRRLIQENGPLSLGYGPKDLQCKFILMASTENFSCCEQSIRLNIVYNISRLTKAHMNSNFHFQLVNRFGSNDLEKTASCFTSISSAGLLLKQNPDRSYKALCSRHRIITGLMALMNNIICNCSAIPPTCNPSKQSHSFSDDQKKEKALEDLEYQSSQSNNLSDIVIKNHEPLENLIYCLTACRSSQLNVARDVALPELASEIFESLQPRSVGDWILVVMKNIFKYCSDKSAFINIVLSTMKSPYFEIHEPFLLFAIWMLSAQHQLSSSSETTCLRYFVENQGLNTICEHLVKSCRYVLGSGTSLLHSTEVALAMTFSAMSGQMSSTNSPLDPLSGGNGSSSGSKATVSGGIGVPFGSHYSLTGQNLVPLVQRKSSQDSGQSGPVIDGLVNFSPYCTISSGSSTGSTGPETLLQPIGPCRRSKPANWTYNFFPDEAFIELTIKLPCVVLLQEIMIQPHVALTSAPSAVSLEFRRFGCIVYPLSPPIDTSGLSQIRLTFSPTLANEVLLRFHKPKNSDALGLTHILVKGRSLFSPISPNSTNESLASLTHLRLLEFILQYAECGLIGELTKTIEEIPDLLVYLCSLLTKKFSEAATVEQILLKLGTSSFVASEKILQCLLKAPTTEFGPIFYRCEESEANHSTENLLYKLGIQDDEHSEARVQLMLKWLRVLGATRHSEAQAKMLVPARHIYVLSVILWHWAVDREKVYDSWKNLLDQDLIQFVFQWTYSLPPQNGKMRSALSCLLCSMTVLKPGTFSCLLKWMNIVGMCSVTDDMKQQYNLSIHTQLENICRYRDLLVIISQADSNVKELLASGVLELVTSQLNHFFNCHLQVNESKNLFTQLNSVFNHAQNSAENFLFSQTDNAKKFNSLSIHDQQCISPQVAIQSLRLLFQLAEADWRFKSWLGQCDNATLFWSPLILLFCSQNHFLNSPEAMTSDNLFNHVGDPDGEVNENVGNISSDINNPSPCKIARNVSIQALGLSERIDLESAAIDFFKAITKFSDINQNRFSLLLCETIVALKENSDALCLPDFLRRLILQVLLEDPSIPVLLSCDSDLFHQRFTPGSNPADIIISSQGKNDQIFLHPRYGAGYNSALKTVSSFTTLSNLASNVLEMSYLQSSAAQSSTQTKTDSLKSQKFNNSDKGNNSNYASPSKDTDANIGLDLIDQISSSSGISLKDLNQSNYSYKNTETCNSDSNENISTNKCNAAILTVAFIDPETKTVFPQESSLNDVIAYYFRKKHDGFSGYLNLQVTVGNRSNRTENVGEAMAFGLDEPSLASPLESFIKIDGLIMLAELLHLLYPGIRKLASSSPSLSNPAPASTGKSFGVGGPGAPTSSYWPMDQWPDDYYDVDLDAMEPYYGQAADFYPANKRNATAPTAKPGLPLLPAHTLIAFALFLRVPGYAEMLIQDWRESLYLLRLLLGVNEDADGVDFLSRNCELPLLPFRVLKRLYQQHPPATDDAALLRLKTLDFGILDLELTCLSVLSHQPPAVANAHNQIISITIEDLQNQLQTSTNSSATGTQTANSNLLNSMMAGSTALSEEKKHYWAKGTGFSTGTVSSTWDSEFALLRQKLEEEHCTVILEVLASFLYPHDEVMLNGETDGDFTLTYDLLPPIAIQMLRDSCLLAVMASYLRNDSVLDMARHVPLYQSLLAVLRSLARIPELHCLLQPQDPKGGSLDIGALLSSMKSCVDTYANRLRKAPTVPKLMSHRGKLTRQMAVRKLNNYKMIEENRQICKKRSDESNTESDNESENLAQLIPDIQRTAKLVALALKKSADLAAAQEALGLQANLMEVTDDQNNPGFLPICEGMSSDIQFDHIYCTTMKPLQFGMYQMVKEDEEGNLSFNVPHHYEHMVRHAGGATQSSSRARRLAQETVTLSTSLPLSSGSTVMVRCDEERLDLMKVLIIGPPDTPYANGAFEFDVFFPMDYPNSPPLINLQTTGNHSVRFNPNLYNEGKVCLSILNTWHGRPEERWNAKTSSFLQVLVSIQSLILVPEPYFNEPGYERSRGTPSGTQASKDYDANIRQATVKWAILEMIKNPPACFKDAIIKHFTLKKEEILTEIQNWIAEYSACSEKNQNSTKSATKHAYIQLKKYFRQLKDEYAKFEKKPIAESSSLSGNNNSNCENKSLEPTEV